jgi:DNA-binding transcriptional regulator LsrR (DeoR family)
MRDEASLATRAAWLHFIGGLTQAEVAARLEVPSIKAHRLIARAAREGIIRVSVEGRDAECVALEQAVAERYRLHQCIVAPDLGDDVPPLRAIGAAGASWLRRVLERNEDILIGVSHGRTLAAAVEQLPHIAAPSTRFVSLLGGLNRHFAANPFDVIHRLAERTGSPAYFMPLPLFTDSAEDRETLLAQSIVREVMALAGEAELLVVGIGEIGESSFLRQSGMLSAKTVKALAKAGAVGETLGHFLDRKGRLVESELGRRLVALPFPALRGKRVVAIGGGAAKIAAVAAVLASGVLTGLVTDEATAQAIMKRRAA